jgi:hypothetical protein
MCHAETMLGELGQFFNLIIMDQTQVNFCWILKKLATWAGIELSGLVQINDCNCIMKKVVGSYEQLLCDNLLEFIRSLEEFVESRNNPKFFKFIIPVLNGRNMKGETVLVPLYVHTMNCYMEDIEMCSLMLLEKPIHEAYAFVLLLGITGVTTLDPLNVSKGVPRSLASIIIWMDKFVPKSLVLLQVVHAMFIINFSKQPFMSLIEVSIIQNHCCREGNTVKLQHLCSSAFELKMNKDSKFWRYAATGNFNLVNTIVDPHLQMLEIEKDYIIFEILVLATTVFSDFGVLYELLGRYIVHAIVVHKFQLSFSSLGGKFLAAFLVFAWHLSVCYLEGLFHLANVKMVVLNSSVRIIPWDPGKFDVFMAKVVCECYWRNSLSIYSLLNWIYGRRNHFHLLPTGLNEESQLEPEPEEALETRRNASREVGVLVTGKGLPCFENSWETS